MKKPTNKYCSTRCSATDPERLDRLRSSAQRAQHRVLPLSRQLALELWPPPRTDAEAEIDLVGEGREDVPRGMSRLAV